jgi:hypothetical protein
MDLEGVVDLSPDSERDLASARKSALHLIDAMVTCHIRDSRPREEAAAALFFFSGAPGSGFLYLINRASCTPFTSGNTLSHFSSKKKVLK